MHRASPIAGNSIRTPPHTPTLKPADVHTLACMGFEPQHSLPVCAICRIYMTQYKACRPGVEQSESLLRCPCVEGVAFLVGAFPVPGPRH